MTQADFQFKAQAGGLRFKTDKQQILQRGIQPGSIPVTLYFPLIDARGQRREHTVEQHQYVRKGEVIARAISEQSVAIHASSSGRILLPDTHAPDPFICIETDGQDQAIDSAWQPIPAPQTAPPEQLLDAIQQAAITGMGGAGYPTHLKLQAATIHQPHTLIVNAVECDPYTVCDSALLLEAFDTVLNGIRIAMLICKAQHCVIAVEEQQTELLSHLRAAVITTDLVLDIVTAPNLYPSGSEQQLVKQICGTTISKKHTALQAGALCLNTATLAALANAVLQAQPLTERVVTLNGSALPQPVNVLARIGTPVETLLSNFGCAANNIITSKVGGVMMGQAMSTEQTKPSVLLKETYSVWATTQTPHPAREQACINCTECAYVCPAQLLPQRLHQLAVHQQWNTLQQDNTLQACIECGACDLVCPSHIPLTQRFRNSKHTLIQIAAETQKAAHAKQRYEAKQIRLEQQAEQKRHQASLRKTRLNAIQEQISGIKSRTNHAIDNQQDME